jgi:hypothetical protein
VLALKTAPALGIDVPGQPLALAEEVIEESVSKKSRQAGSLAR